MNNPPNTFGQMRRELAGVLHDVRYGHIEVNRAIAVAKVAAQIASLMDAEIRACQFLSEIGHDTQRLGHLPINRVRGTLDKTGDGEP